MNIVLIFFRTSEKYLSTTIARMKELNKKNELYTEDFIFLSSLLSKKELSQKDISIICLSLFTDGLSTVSHNITLNCCSVFV